MVGSRKTRPGHGEQVGSGQHFREAAQDTRSPQMLLELKKQWGQMLSLGVTRRAPRPPLRGEAQRGTRAKQQRS